MELAAQYSFLPTFWLLLGLLFLAIEIFLLGNGVIFLPFSIAAFITAGFVYLYEDDHIGKNFAILEWYHTLALFAILSIIAAISLHFITRNKKRKNRPTDINDY